MKTELFNAGAALADDLGVDKVDKVIRGCKVIQLGELNDDRPFFADRQTLDNVLELMSQPKKGLKARFTHSAALGGDGLNTHLGRWVNPRIDGDSVRADLKLAEAAEITPVGNLAEFLMTLADEDPESFGVSVAGILDSAMFDENNEIHAIRFERMWSADVVGDPAATRGGLFSNANLEVNPMAENLETPVEELAQVDAVEVTEEKIETIEEALAEIVTVDSLRDDAKPFVEAFGNQGAAWFLEGKDLLECYKQSNAELSEVLLEMQKQLDELVEALSVSEESNGEAEPLSVAAEVPVESADALAKRERVEKLRQKGASKNVIGWASQYHN